MWLYFFLYWSSNVQVFKQKLNTKSITESGVVGTSNYVPNMIYTDLFLKHQSVILQSSEFAQYDQSAMKLEINGKRSCRPGYRCMDTKHFV